jgi:hypothetical protein
MIKTINIATHLKYIYILLFIAWIVNQINQNYRFDLLNHNKIISHESQNLFEAIAELGLAVFSTYILFKFNVDNILLRCFLIICILFYSIDGILSTIVLFDTNNETIKNINRIFFFT